MNLREITPSAILSSDAHFSEIFIKAVALLRAGSSVIIKTDTLYSISCDASNRDAINNIFLLKGRQREKSLPVFVSSVEQGMEYAEFNKSALQLAKNFWPGALTLILKSKNKLPMEIQGGSLNIAIRIPNDRVITEVTRCLGRPIIGTSANISGQEDITNSGDINKVFGKDALLVVDSGAKHDTFGQPSTIVDCTRSEIIIMRQGVISEDRLYKVIT